MATWNVTPSVPHTGGTFDFPKNTTNNGITYTISYTDDNGCSSSTTYTVPGCLDCSVYQFSSIETPLETHTTTSIAYSLYSLEQLTYTIMNSGGFLTGITVVHSADRWQYMGLFNTTTSTSDRTATIEYRNGDGTCTFTQQLVMKGETDCSKYGFTANTLNEVPSVSSSQQLALSIYSEGELTATVVNGSDVVTGITAPTVGPYYQYIGWFAENQSTFSKHAKIRYTSSDGCEWEQTVRQKGDCTKYQFEDMSPTIDVSGTGLNYPTVAKTSYGPNINPLLYLTGSTWITYQGTREEHNPDKFLYKISCSQNDGSARTGSITFTNNDGCTFTATVKQNGKNVTVSLRGITPIDGNLDLVGTDYSMHCTWNNGVKTVECSNTPNTADTAQNIFISAGGVSYRDGSIIKSATLVNNCSSQSSTYFRLVSAQWSVYSDRYELDMLFSPCGT